MTGPSSLLVRRTIRGPSSPPICAPLWRTEIATARRFRNTVPGWTGFWSSTRDVSFSPTIGQSSSRCGRERPRDASGLATTTPGWRRHRRQENTMPVDNEIYNRAGDIWWDEHQPLNAILTAINPARLDYFTRVLMDLGVDPSGKTVVDIGCGGGLFAEEFAKLGAQVIGVDPSAASLATARSHAAGAGWRIDYREGSGERLPLDDASVDIACCVDVLEHVRALDAGISETARVLRPGGVYLFDTINRTRT